MDGVVDFGLRIVLPPHDSHPLPAFDPRAGKNLAQWSTAIAGLAYEAEALVQDSLDLAGADIRISHAFVADEQSRESTGHHDQQGFLESRIVCREVGQVGEMLPIAIDKEGIIAGRPGTLSRRLEASLIHRGWYVRLSGGHTEFRKHDLGKFSPALRHCLPSGTAMQYEREVAQKQVRGQGGDETNRRIITIRSTSSMPLGGVRISQSAVHRRGGAKKT